jgi:hypothetical protein
MANPIVSQPQDGDHAIGSCPVPTWTIADEEMHPWQVNVRGDWAGHFARVTADHLDVTGNGTLVFTKGDEICLVIQPAHYSHVRLVDWTGLIPAEGFPGLGAQP